MKNKLLSLTLLLSAGHLRAGDFFFDVRRAQRRGQAHTVKAGVADFDETKALPNQTRNGDEQTYSDKRGSFNKALTHQDNGFPNVAAFNSMVVALETGDPSAFNQINTGGERRLVNPQGSLAFSLAGNDAWINMIPPAPNFSSAQTAGEMVELYWTALVRDVPFNQFGSNGTVSDAVDDLNTMSDFRGPKDGGVVTFGTFLRGNAPGELDGPYISQFLYQDIPYGATTVGPENTVPTATTNNDFLKGFGSWFTVATGGSVGTITLDNTPHFIRTPRDLGEYVHKDFPGQEGLNALLILMSYGDNAVDKAHPYLNNAKQEGFTSFGPGDAVSLVITAAHEALKAAWYHKWQVNRRLRPEEFGFYVNHAKDNNISLDIHSDLLYSQALIDLESEIDAYFLPIAYPEGSPTHPSYPAGHATVMGAVVTILKALFNEDFIIPLPLMPDAMNTSLIAYGSGDLTVGGELNKLASNVSLGRDHAGVHYRSDGWQGMLLGEQVAIDLLNNNGFIVNENFSGYSLTTFEGNKITVGAKQNVL